MCPLTAPTVYAGKTILTKKSLYMIFWLPDTNTMA